MAWIAQISHDSGSGWVNGADFVQIALNFEGFIYHGANWKMVCEFGLIHETMGGFLVTWGVYMHF